MFRPWIHKRICPVHGLGTGRPVPSRGVQIGIEYWVRIESFIYKLYMKNSIRTQYSIPIWTPLVPSPWISFSNFTFEYLVLLVSSEKLRSVDKLWICPFFGWFPISSGFPAFLSDTLTDQQVVANVLLSVLSALTSDWSRGFLSCGSFFGWKLFEYFTVLAPG